MKIKKAFDICKKSKIISTFKNNDDQWLSDGKAAYPLNGLPELTEECICRLYDIKDTQREKIKFFINRNKPVDINFEDMDGSESDTEAMNIGVVIDGIGVCLPIMTEEGLMFIERRYLEPLFDVQQNDIFIKLRRSKEGINYLAVKVGLLLFAVILPVEITDEFVVKLGDLYSAAIAANENRKLKSVELEGQTGDE